MSKSEKLKFQMELDESTKKIANKNAQESGEVFKWSYVFILLICISMFMSILIVIRKLCESLGTRATCLNFV